MKKPAALFVVGVVVVFIGGVLVRSSRPVPNRSRVPAAARWTSGMGGWLRGSSAEMVSAVSKQRVVAAYGRLPLSFEANRGQTAAQVKFLSRGSGYSLFLTGTETVLALSRGHDSERARRTGLAPRSRVPEIEEKPAAATSVLRMKLAGANAAAQVEGIDELPGKTNYFIGNDPAKWRTNVPHYAKVRYRGVYPGVDLVYYGNQQQVEHDFIISPAADPSAIRLSFQGAEKLSVDARGDLVLTAEQGEVRLQKPVIYQEVGGVRREVAGGYKVEGSQVSFQVAPYDASQALVIDPVLVYSTYLGGSDFEVAQGIAVDSAGSAYIVGWARSRDFPTQNPLQPTHAGGDICVSHPNFVPAPCFDVFVTKLTPQGNALVYSTYLGGSGQDRSYGIAVDSAGSAYIAGRTQSTDFPTQNNLQPASLKMSYGLGLWDGFVTKLNPQGNALVYSTYLGGSGFDFPIGGVAVDSAGNAYVTGMTNSPDFPTKNPLYGFNGAICNSFPFEAKGDIKPPAPCLDAFVTKINPEGSALVYSTYLGGSGHEEAWSIAVDAQGNAYLRGFTTSTDFPTTDDAYQRTYGGGSSDAFVTKLNPQGSALVYSTYLGGSGDEDQGFHGIAVDSSGNAYVGGATNSTNFPTTPGALQTALGGGTCGSPPRLCYDAFVAKLNPAGSQLVYSTYLGGSKDDFANHLALDSAGNVYVGGETNSLDFPTQNPLQPNFGGGPRDAFVAKLNPDGSALVYSTYLGGSRVDSAYGIAVDSTGNAYVAGPTDSTNFPTKNAFQPNYKGGGTTPPGLANRNAFVTKIAAEANEK